MVEARTSSDPIEWPVPWTPVEGTRGGVAAWLEHLALRAATVFAARLPEFLLKPTIETLARLASVVDKKHTSDARVFIRQALGNKLSEAELDERALQAYRHLIGITIRSETWHRKINDSNWREHLTLELSPEFEALRGQGSIMITPHLGDWEVAGAFLNKLGFHPVYAIAKPPKNLPLSRHLQQTREGRGVRMLPRRGGIQHAAKVVEGGGILCLLIDQRGRGRNILAPFFGRQALCDRSAGVLLKRLKVPIAIGAVYLADKPDHYRIHAQTVFQPADFANASVEEIITHINGELEKLILQAPEQYFWLHERYRGAPE